MNTPSRGMLWFRVYSDIVNDPKLQTLPPKLFRALINLWALAAQNDGFLPPDDEIAFRLRMKPNETKAMLAQLRECRLIDETPDGLTPHNWSARQYRSDHSNERVARYRERKRNGTCNVTGHDTETAPDSEADTEAEANTESDTEQTPSSPAATASERPKRSKRQRYDKPYSLDFERFWSTYPKREGSSDKKEAWASFQIALENGATAEAIIAGAAKYASQERKVDHVGTRYVKMPATWLNKQAWEDFAADAHVPSGIITIEPGSGEWNAWRAHYSDANDIRKLREMNKFADKGAAFPVPQLLPPSGTIH